MTNGDRYTRVLTLDDFDRELARDGGDAIRVPASLAAEYGLFPEDVGTDREIREAGQDPHGEVRRRWNNDGYHRRFADMIIGQIRRGIAPWQRSWGPCQRVLPSNIDTGRYYAGGNSLHLASVAQERGYVDVRWGTRRQIQARGGLVYNSERGTRILSIRDRRRLPVVDERGRPVRDDEGNRVHRYERLPVPYVRQYTVFNAEQTFGLPAPPTPPLEPLWKLHQDAERVLADSGVPVRHVADRCAHYDGDRDEIVLPQHAWFPSATKYYQIAIHELCHSTGHPERLNRATLIDEDHDGFGSPVYAKEELRAMIGAMITGERIGVGHALGGYVHGWIAALEEDPREIRRAAADAQRISDFILARSREREATHALERERGLHPESSPLIPARCFALRP